MLSIDIGPKHTVACYSVDKIHYNIFLFQSNNNNFE